MFFHSKASKAIWIASRKTLSFTIAEDDIEGLYEWDQPSFKAGEFSLPPCPSYLSEPAYAAFLFDPTCSFCPQNSFTVGTGSLTAKICGDCYGKDFCTLQSLQDAWSGDADPRLYDILSQLETAHRGRKAAKAAKWYHRPTCQALFDKALQYEMEVKLNTRMINAFFNKGEEEIKERKAFMAARFAFESAKASLAHMESRRKIVEAEERFNRNKVFVVLKFEQEGRETFLSDLDDCPRACDLIETQERDMNDEDFARLKDRLIEQLNPVQEERRHMTAYYDPENSRIRGILDSFRVTLPIPEGLARQIRLADMAELDICKALAANPTFVNGDEDAQKTIWAENLDNIRGEIAAWVNAKEEAILAVLEEEKARKLQQVLPTQHHIYDVTLSKEYLRMPYTTFACTTCPSIGPTKLSEVLVHGCYAKYLPWALPHTRRRLNSEGVSTYVSLSAPITITSHRLQMSWEKTSIYKNVYDAVVKAGGGEPPASLKDLRRKLGTLACGDCPEDIIEHTGISVAMSLMHHIASSYHIKSKVHRNFTYTLPEGGEDAEAHGNANSPTWHPDFVEEESVSADFEADMHGFEDFMQDAMWGFYDA